MEQLLGGMLLTLVVVLTIGLLIGAAILRGAVSWYNKLTDRGIPPAGTSVSSPVDTCFRRAPVTPLPGPPRIFSTVLFQIQPILGLRCARSCMIFDARRLSRRCTTST